MNMLVKIMRTLAKFFLNIRYGKMPSRAVQKNYNSKNNRGFIYADTDSIHL